MQAKWEAWDANGIYNPQFDAFASREPQGLTFDENTQIRVCRVRKQRR